MPSHTSNADIRIPLEWREFESRKGKLGKAVQHKFVLCDLMLYECASSPSQCIRMCTRPHCSVSCVLFVQDGHEVVDTTDVVEVERTTSDIVFDGMIHL